MNRTALFVLLAAALLLVAFVLGASRGPPGPPQQAAPAARPAGPAGPTGLTAPPVERTGPPAGAWVDRGRWLLLEKDDGATFAAESPSAACLPEHVSYDGVPFLTKGAANRDGKQRKLALGSGRSVSIPAGDRAVAAVHLLAGGTIGNTVNGGTTVLAVTFLYADGSREEVTGEVTWDWSPATDADGAHFARRAIAGGDPCRPERPVTLYRLRFENPDPSRQVRSLAFSDGWHDEYPSSNVIAVSVELAGETPPPRGDVWVRFDEARCNQFFPFSRTAGVVGATYRAALDATDENFTEVRGAACCPGPGNGFAAQYESGGATRMGPWVAERRRVEGDRYKLLVRGAAQADCQCGTAGFVKGEAGVVPGSGWRISAVDKCTFNASDRPEPVYCTVDREAGTVRFAGGSTCGGCCACIDSGAIDIELTLERAR